MIQQDRKSNFSYKWAGYGYILLALIFIELLTPAKIIAQPLPDTDFQQSRILLQSMDSVLASIHAMEQEKAQLRSEFRRLSARINTLERSLEQSLSNQTSFMLSAQDTLLRGLDTLRVLMPSDEPIRTTSTNILYLSQRQDSLAEFIGRLEKRIISLPDKHYWGVRNGFEQFDHLLLFTFLGAITSLGVVLLIKGGPQKDDPTSDPITSQENEADRLSISITLLVGSVLVILFILFIL